MKGNTRGFTLVELLAVIVILAIVALVTTPAILNVINDSRRSGAEDKAWGTMDAVRLAYVQSQSLDNDTELGTGVYTVSFKDGDSTSGVHIKEVGTRKVTVSGEMPTSGNIKIDGATGKITAVGLTFTQGGKYVCTSDVDGTAMCCKSGTTAPTGTGSEASCGKKSNANGKTLAS